MSHTVGLIGANGRVGKEVARYLSKAAQQDRIKLVLFHREGRPPTGIQHSANVELRILDIETDTKEDIVKAVKGIHVVISTLGFGAVPYEPKLVEAIVEAGDAVTYVPSVYSTTWNEADFADPKLGPILGFLHGGADRAEKLGLSVTTIYAGVFEDYWFELGFMGSALKDKVIWANDKQMQNEFPITSLRHMGLAMANIGVADPKTTAGKSYSVVTFWASGKELRDLHAQLTGGDVQVKDFTTADREAQRDAPADFGPAKAGYWDKWETGTFAYDAPGVIVDDSYDGPSLAETGKRYL